jgi:hypothetical protein
MSSLSKVETAEVSRQESSSFESAALEVKVKYEVESAENGVVPSPAVVPGYVPPLPKDSEKIADPR